MITHGSLFAGMECATVVLVTRYMGLSLARSNIMRAVARLIVITDSVYAKKDVLKKHFTVVQEDDDELDQTAACWGWGLGQCFSVNHGPGHVK